MARQIEYRIGGGSWVTLPDLSPTFTISGLTNGSSYSIEIRVIDDGEIYSLISAPSIGTPSAVADYFEIDTINSGNGQMFVNHESSENFTDLEYQLDSGDWVSVITANPLIIPIDNSSSTVSVKLRATFPSGVIETNAVDGRATERINLDQYPALDTDLQSEISNVTFEIDPASDDYTVLHESGVSGNGEAWEGDSLSGGMGTVLVDHEGYLRFYYELRALTPARDKSSVGYIKSIDGGVTWEKQRVNLDTAVINDPDSNLISIALPSGASAGSVRQASVYYDSNAITAERYKLMCEFDGLTGWYVLISDDGLTFTTPVRIIGSIQGDSGPGSIMYDDNISKWVSFGRGRRSPADDTRPDPYNDVRFVIRNESDNFDDSFWTTISQTVVEPSEVWGYDEYPGGDNQFISNGVTCFKWRPNPNDGYPNGIKPDIYRGNVSKVGDYYLAVFPVYRRDDFRVPMNRPDRTTGEIRPTYGISKDGINWVIPSDDCAIGTTPYERVDNGQCNTNQGATEVGQLMSSFEVCETSDKVWIPVLTRPQTHYESVEAGDPDIVSSGWDYENTYPGPNTTLDDDNRFLAIQSNKKGRYAKYVAGSTEGHWRSSRLFIPTGTTALEINSNGTVKVEILNSITGTPITGFTKSDSNTISADAIDNTAGWTSNSISELAGQNCRVKIYATNGAVYGFRFT